MSFWDMVIFVLLLITLKTTYLQEPRAIFNDVMSLFIFSRHTDPQYVKTKKLDILTTIASVSNVEDVVTELRWVS